MVAKLWYLKKIDILNELPQDKIEKVSNMTRMDEVDSNTPIYFPGDPSDMIYILKKGRVKISRETPDGKRITLAFLEPGEIFGELAVAGEEERTTMAEATEDSLICAAPKDKFMDFLSDNPELALEVSKVIGDRRRKIESKIENLIFKDARGRLAQILRELFNEHSDNGEQEATPEISFSHQDIADLTGLTRPTTTNLLNEFEEQGIIELNRRKIILHNPVKLKQRSTPDS
ncbi:MAG: Crp/Fnr family transcriptional regulator [bacterium]